jgi:hypothetical protein
MRILIDGDYRSQARGTGISTYSRSLGERLKELQHDVLWLSGVGAPREADDPLVDAAYAGDDTPDLRGPRAYIKTALNML